MDINEIMHMAVKNKQKAQKNKTSQYSTTVPPAKKLQRNVNPAAIQAVLQRKANEEKQKAIENTKKKEALLELRQQKGKKTVARANAMAKRTKDNFHGLNASAESSDHVRDVLSPEQDKRHKNFMKKLDQKVNKPNKEKPRRSSADLAKVDNKNKQKINKTKKKARAAANLNFSDLLQIAQSNKTAESSDESNESETDSDSLSMEEKYRREKRKRRELEERLNKSNNKHNLKKGKTKQKPVTTLSEAEKQAKIKAIAKKFNKSKEEIKSKQPTKNKCMSNNVKSTNNIANRNTVNNNIGQTSKQRPPSAKCTLKVTSESVRTNYPGVAKADPYVLGYSNGKLLKKRAAITPAQIAQYKQARMMQRRPQESYDEEDDSEYDSEMEGFIEDEEDNIDVSSHIKSIFGYDKSKYGRESEWELSRMDVGYRDIEKEEKRSLRIAKQEDAREAKLEEERLKRKMKKKK